MNITEEVSKYLREYAVKLFTDKVLDVTDFCRTEGKIRDYCYSEISDVFDDAMDEFTLSEIIDDACEKLVQEIKDLLYERTGDECCNEDEIDREIWKLEIRIQKLKELDDQ